MRGYMEREISMRTTLVLLATVLMAGAAAAPALAADSMMSSKPAMASDAMAADHGTMMKKGEAMLVMPNGESMTVETMGGPGEEAMMKMAKPLDKCVVFMMGKDGKMYMAEDAKMSSGQMLCDDMAMMKK